MIAGRVVRKQGVFANGVPLPPDAPSIAAYLHEKAGYRTALLGKAHFEPAFDMAGRWRENRMGREGDTGPGRGVERVELAMHGPIGGWHYLAGRPEKQPAERGGGAPLVSPNRGGE